MKIACTMLDASLYHFTYTDNKGGEKYFQLTEAEILELKGKEYPTLPNRFQFGFIEPVIGKMVMTLEFLYPIENFPGKSIEVVEA